MSAVVSTLWPPRREGEFLKPFLFRWQSRTFPYFVVVSVGCLFDNWP